MSNAASLSAVRNSGRASTFVLVIFAAYPASALRDAEGRPGGSADIAVDIGQDARESPRGDEIRPCAAIR